MMQQALSDYVKIYENHLPASVCKSACKNLEESSWSEHKFYRSSDHQLVSFEKELSVSYQPIFESDAINKSIWYAIEKYILKDFANFSEWFNGWSGYSHVRFNRYDPETRMKLHCDHIHSLFDGERKGIPILTLVGALNDDYEGGEFVLFGDQKVALPTGSIAVFPSNFLYPHEVKPVKSGVRYSFVSWAW